MTQIGWTPASVHAKERATKDSLEAFAEGPQPRSHKDVSMKFNGFWFWDLMGL